VDRFLGEAKAHPGPSITIRLPSAFYDQSGARDFEEPALGVVAMRMNFRRAL
jgi:hypothetical protein